MNKHKKKKYIYKIVREGMCEIYGEYFLPLLNKFSKELKYLMRNIY